MSVIKFTAEQLGMLANSVLCKSALFDRAGIPFTEKAKFALYSDKGMTWAEQKLNFLAFMDRLFVANQVAHDFSYNENFDIIRLKKENVNGFHNDYVLLRELKSLRYNLVTNAGRTFTSEEDESRLDTLISVLSHIIIENQRSG